MKVNAMLGMGVCMWLSNDHEAFLFFLMVKELLSFNLAIL